MARPSLLAPDWGRLLNNDLNGIEATANAAAAAAASAKTTATTAADSAAAAQAAAEAAQAAVDDALGGGGVSTADSAVARLDRTDSDARRLAGGNAAIAYEDSTELVEDWTDTSNVLAVANGQVVDNRWYAVTGSAPGGWNKQVDIPTEGRWRLQTLLYFKAGGSGSAYFGINCGTPGKTLVAGDPDTLAVGIGATNVRTISLGSALTSINSLNGASLGTVASTDATYLITFEADDEDISLTMKRLDQFEDVTVWSFERAALAGLGKTVNNLTCYLTDSRGASGHGFGPWILTTESMQPSRTKTVASQLIEGSAHRIRRCSSGVAAANNAWVYALPKNYDPRRPSPLVIWAHHSITGSAWDWIEEARIRPVAEALLDAGYMIAGVNEPSAIGQWGMGNQVSQDEYLELYRFMSSDYNVGPLFWYAASMGGLDVANAISRREFPTPAAVAVVGGAYDLGYIWDLGSVYQGYVENAYGASGRDDLLAKSVGYDPIRNDTDSFRGVPWRLYTSTGDTVQPSSGQEAFADHIEPNATEVSVVYASGAHMDPSQFQPEDVLAFFESYR